MALALLYIIGGLLLAAGSGLVIVALLHLEVREREGYVSQGWKVTHEKEDGCQSK